MTDDFIHATQLLRAGRFDEALGAFRLVYAGARANGNSDLMAAALGEMAWSCYRIGDPEQGLECALAARRLWQQQDNDVELARALAVAAMLYLDLGFSDQADASASQALALAIARDDAGMLAFALSARSLVLAACRQSARGARLVEQAVAIAAHQANPAGAAYYLLNLGICHAGLADEADAGAEPDRAARERATAIEVTAIAIQYAQHGGDVWTLRVALANNARLLALQGSTDAALVLLDQCADLLDQPGLLLQLLYLDTLSAVLLRAGRLQEARDSAVKAVQLADSGDQLEHQVSAAGRLAEILEALGDAPAALDQFKRYHALYVRQAASAAQRRARIEAIGLAIDVAAPGSADDDVPRRRRA
jgi:tetratricopeptide (TPR) repeat protein